MNNATDPLDRIRDELLVVRCQLGEPAAFHDLVQQWSGRLLRHLRRTAGPDLADDLAQEVWIRALRGIVRLRDGRQLRGCLFGIAHNVLMDRLRSRYAESAMLATLAEEPSPEADDNTEARLLLLDDRLAGLPVLERETLTLFYLEELTLAELAGVQGVPVGTVKSRLFRARRLLRETMPKGADNAA